MEDGIVVLNNIVYVLHLCYYAFLYVEMVGNVLALRMKGTITFQLAPGELAALRMRGTSSFQLALGELGRGTITF